MGWKASTIIINKPTQIDNEKLLQNLGFKDLTKINDEPFEKVINPDENEVYIGQFQDNLLICAPALPMQFFDMDTITEEILKKTFPNSEICSIVLHSSVNLWGYFVIKNGKKIRTRAGSSEDGTFLDFGEPLPEEKELLSKSSINNDGKRTYILDEDDEEPMTEDQVGEEFVFAISKRYFGKELDRADDSLFETMMSGYSYSTNDNEIIEDDETPKSKPKFEWKVYLLIIGLIIIWQIVRRVLLND